MRASRRPALISSPALSALASTVIYALALVLVQAGLRHRSAMAGALVSLPTTTLAFWILWLATRDPARFDWTGFAIFAGTGFLYPVAVTILSFESNRHLGPNLAGSLSNATPLFAVLFGIMVLGERLTPARALGLALVVAGVVLLSIRREGDRRQWPPVALLLPLGVAALRGAVQPVVKLGLAYWADPLAAVTMGYSVSCLVLLAVSLIRGRGRIAGWTWEGAGTFMLVGLCNGFSVLLLFVALSLASVSLVAPLSAAYPLFTLLFSALLLRHEPLHGRLVAGVALTVAGVVVVLAS